MRQAGIIAAAGIYALEHMVDRLADDDQEDRRGTCRLRKVETLKAWATRWLLALGVCGVALALLALLESKVPGTIVLACGMFLIPGLAFWADQREKRG